MSKRRTFPYAFAFVAAALAGGCPGSLEDPERFTEGGAGSCPPGTDVIKDIFGNSCTSSLCHDAPKTSSPPKASDDPAAGLDLTQNVESQILGVTSKSGEECDGRLLVDPNDPEGSLFLNKITNKTPTCGDRMPLATPLSAAETDCVRKWLIEITGGKSDAGSAGAGGSPSDGGSE